MHQLATLVQSPRGRHRTQAHVGHSTAVTASRQKRPSTAAAAARAAPRAERAQLVEGSGSVQALVWWPPPGTQVTTVATVPFMPEQ